MNTSQATHRTWAVSARTYGPAVKLAHHAASIAPSATTYDAILLSLALLAELLHNIPSGPTLVLGSSAMVASVGLSILMVVRRSVFPTALRTLALLWLALLLMYVLRLSPGLLSYGVKTVFQLATVVVLVLSISSVKWDMQALTTFIRCAIPASGWCAVAYVLARHGRGPFAEISMNMIGVWGFLAFGLCVVSAHVSQQLLWKLLSVAGCALAAAVLFASASRAALVGALSFLALYLLWPFLRRGRWQAHLYFAFMVGLLVFFPWLFTFGGLTAARFKELQFLMWDVFEKNLNTRADVWGHSLNVFLESPWIGHGTGFWPFREEVALKLSCHNTFLNIAVQTGALGAGIFVLILWSIWSIYVRSQHSAELRPFAAFLAGLIMLRSFETGMTENDLATGYFEWAVVSIGISCAIYGTLRSLTRHTPAHQSKRRSIRQGVVGAYTRRQRS